MRHEGCQPADFRNPWRPSVAGRPSPGAREAAGRARPAPHGAPLGSRLGRSTSRDRNLRRFGGLFSGVTGKSWLNSRPRLRVAAMDDVRAFLDRIGFAQYADAFAKNDIDMALLAELTPNDLKELGVASLGHRKKILSSVRQIIIEKSAQADDKLEELPPASVEKQEELRDVTTVFADLTNYAGLAREIDAEELHEIISIFYDRLNEIVLRMGGAIERHIGDCVMAVFGAPVSHGNDAERALRATIEMHRAMEAISRRFGRALTIHIGAAVGTVLFSTRGYGQRKDKDFSLTGDTVNLASRLADEAKPGETLIDHRLLLALSDRIDCDEGVSLHVKGYAEPVRAHRFNGFRSAAERSPLVGRLGETALLREAVRACAAQGVGAAIELRGEAGMGKTRLAHAARVEAERTGLRCCAALFLDFGLGETRNALVGLFRSMVGLGERAEPEAIAAVVARLTREGVLTENAALFAVTLLGGKLDRRMTLRLAAMDDAAMAASRDDAMRRILRHHAAQAPHLLLIEDIHWAEGWTLPMLKVLVAETQASPVVVIVTTRPEGAAIGDEDDPCGDGDGLRRIALGPLTASEATELARTTLSGDDAMLAECVEKSQGNPLFLVQMLSHADDAGGQVPSSIQSLIQARFDRLSPTEKRLLHAAAIVGQRFSMDAVTRIAGIAASDAGRLVDAALIKPLDDGYLFAHALIRDGILRTLLRKDRRALHAAAAEWFAGKDLVLHAQHLAEADDPAAAPAFLAAAREAWDAFRKDAALAFAESGLRCAPDLRTKGALLRVKGDVLRETGRSEASIACFVAAEECARDPSDLCRAQIGIVAGMRILDRIDDAYVVLDRAERIAEQAGLLTELSETHYLRGCLHFPRGDLEGCRREHEKALDYARRAGLPRRQALALSGLGDAAYARGRMFTAHGVIEQCLSLCDAHGLADVECANRFMLATAKIYLTETEAALDEALRSAALAEQMGAHRPEIVSRLTAGWILTSMARYADARAEAEKGLGLAARLGAKRFTPFLEETLARVAFHEGDRALAADIAEGALRRLREVHAESFIGPWVLSTVALTTPDPARRRAALAEGEALLAKGCVGHNHFRFHRYAMQACLNAGDDAAASRYADALERYTAGEPTPWSDFHIARTRAMLALSRGDADPDALDAIARRAAASGLMNALPQRIPA
ncbi:MAG: adenylate/guanylate cyclase domain-containing protein [Rhodobacteraceae bacterium]|nr:MAG: adenylate/guanylate cyclase domain-containing protein [Paracoccaceae bacterium]